MIEIQTKSTDRSPLEVLASVPHSQKQEDGKTLLAIFGRVTGQDPVVWGTKLIGYGRYHYEYATGHGGDIYAAGFHVTKRNITLHLNLDKPELQDCLSRLGKFTRGKSCLYINKLSDVDLSVLEELIRKSWNTDMGKIEV